MNSLQKQNTEHVQETHESFVASFEKKLLEMNDLVKVDILMKKLQFIGINFDPFMPEIGDECEQIMENLGLTPHMKNPYTATNILLRLLDKTEERLNNLKH